MTNPLSHRGSNESICLRAFLLAMGERALMFSVLGDNSETAKEEETAHEWAIREARNNGFILPRFRDFMAKTIQAMGYIGDEGHRILTFFKSIRPKFPEHHDDRSDYAKISHTD